MKKNSLAILVLLTCIIFFLVLALLINLSIKPTVDTKALKEIFIVSLIGHFQPEPQERTLYLLFTLSSPFLCGLVYVYLGRIILRGQKTLGRNVYRSVNYLSIAVVLGLAIWGLRNADFSYFGASSLIQSPILTLVINIILFILVIQLKPWTTDGTLFRRLIPGLIYFSLGTIFIGLIFMETVFNDYESYVPLVHFVAYFDSVVQVYLGKTLLVDFPTQYGLYALFLVPIFKIIGLNVIKFTYVMGCLKVITYVSILLVIWRVSQNKLIGLMGFAAIVFYTRLRVPFDISRDPYFQYNPHRMIFPAVFIFLVGLYLSCKKPVLKKSLYILISILCPVSALWNPDTGLVVIASWLILLLFIEFLALSQIKFRMVTLNCIRHFAINFMAAFFSLLGFYFYTYISSGLLPDIASAADYSRIFYFYGFYMMPMPAIHPWNMVALVYLVGIFLSIGYLIDANGYQGIFRRTEQNTFIISTVFALSVMGIGLFNYYVGRSHDLNLIWTTWPILILVTIFTDQLFSKLSPLIYNSVYDLKTKLLVAFRKDIFSLLFIGLFYFLSTSLPSIIMVLPAYFNVILERDLDVLKGRPRLLNNQVDFINSTSTAVDTILILSDFAPELYLYSSHARPVNVPGFGELLLRKEVEKISAFLAHPPQGAKIYWEPDFKLIRPEDFNNLHIVATAQKNHIILFEGQVP